MMEFAEPMTLAELDQMIERLQKQRMEMAKKDTLAKQEEMRGYIGQCFADDNHYYKLIDFPEVWTDGIHCELNRSEFLVRIVGREKTACNSNEAFVYTEVGDLPFGWFADDPQYRPITQEEFDREVKRMATEICREGTA